MLAQVLHCASSSATSCDFVLAQILHHVTVLCLPMASCFFFTGVSDSGASAPVSHSGGGANQHTAATHLPCSRGSHTSLPVSIIWNTPCHKHDISLSPISLSLSLSRLLLLGVNILKEKLISNALERTILRERVYNAALDFFRLGT